VSANQAIHRVGTQCRVLEVSRSGYYAWVDRPESRRSREDAGLTKRIRTIHAASRGTYGAPRVHAELAAQGVRVGRKRVARLMAAVDLRGVCRRKRCRTTLQDKELHPTPDLVDRNFKADAPNRLWVADITYIRTWEGFLYLAMVLDVFSRRIVGWVVGTTLQTRIVLAALEAAVARRRPSGVIHHSDRGSQYTSVAFSRRCEQLGVVPSLGSVGDAFDNAMAESFFASLECELLDRTVFRTKAAAKAALFDWIERWYNPRRRHSKLSYLSPVDFEHVKAWEARQEHRHVG
jgi:putative transposase